MGLISHIRCEKVKSNGLNINTPFDCYSKIEHLPELDQPKYG